MKPTVLLLTSIISVACQEIKEDVQTEARPNHHNEESVRSEIAENRPKFTLDRTIKYSLVDPIPEGDKWLALFKKGHDYLEGKWETWVWRKTDIDLGEGIVVYARNEDEVQFLVTGIPQLKDVMINFRDKVIGADLYFGGMHIGTLSPSKNYFVVITDHPRSYLYNGMNLHEKTKANYDWKYEFNGDKVTFWKYK